MENSRTLHPLIEELVTARQDFKKENPAERHRRLMEKGELTPEEKSILQADSNLILNCHEHAIEFIRNSGLVDSGEDAVKYVDVCMADKHVFSLLLWKEVEDGIFLKHNHGRTPWYERITSQDQTPPSTTDGI